MTPRSHGPVVMILNRMGVLLASFLISTAVLSQAIITLDNSNPYQRIGTSVFFIKDPDRAITFDDIRDHRYDDRYVQSDQEANNLGNIQMAVWNKFTVTNKSTEKWLLLVENYSLDTLEFYYRDTITHEYHVIKSGRSLPFSQLKYKTNIFVFDLPVKRGDTTTFYLKVDTYFFQYPMILSTEERFVALSHRKDLLTGIYYGLVVVFMLYNLFVFFSVRDQNYLYYVVYIFFNALLIAQLKGLTAELFGDTLHFLWDYAPAVIAVTSIVSFIFTRRILETRKWAPKWDKIILWGFYPNYLLIIILSMAHQNLYASLVNQLSGILALFFLFAIAVKVYNRGFKPARFYIVACFFYFMGVFIYVMKSFNILPFNAITNNSVEIGSTFQMIMFSFVIADRLRLFKKEKEKAQDDLVQSLRENQRLITEQKDMLEVKVKERTRELRETMEDLSEEKERSEKLLLNILPFETAQELKQGGKSEPRFFEEVTVMFTDFKDFTQFSEKLTPAELVHEIDSCFRAFDEIVGRHNVEKIKTIGDSYMAAGGLPVANNSHAEDVLLAAMEIMAFVERRNKIREQEGKRPLEIRIGIHTGSVIAGIVGTKKFAYDIWGDTVNTASRMESSGEIGKINVSGVTYGRVQKRFAFIHRGKIEAKNKGVIDMYFLDPNNKHLHS